MHCEPRRVRILLTEDPSSFQNRPRLWRCLFCERVENRGYITWLRRLNLVHNIWIVNGRFSIRSVVGDLGFCDLDSPDIYRRAIFRTALVILRALATRVLVGFTAGLNNTDAIFPPFTATNLCQRLLEVSPVALPLNVLISLPIANIDRVRCDSWVRDGWKTAAADDHNHYDYA